VILKRYWSSDWSKWRCTLWRNVNSRVLSGIGSHFNRSVENYSNKEKILKKHSLRGENRIIGFISAVHQVKWKCHSIDAPSAFISETRFSNVNDDILHLPRKKNPRSFKIVYEAKLQNYLYTVNRFVLLLNTLRSM